MYGAMWLVSMPGEPVPLLAGVALLVCWGLYKKRYKLTSWFAAANLVIIAVVEFLKRITEIPRPTESTKIDFAFPSGHVATYVVFWGLLIYWVRKSNKPRWLKVLVFVLGITLVSSVGLSRVYLQEHWISDVVAGYLIGSIVLGCAILVYPKSKEDC